jgi:hypothetical protein
VPTEPPKTTQADPPETTTPGSDPDASALNDQAWGLMQDGDFASALALLERAVPVLAGSGSLAEAYASYNLAFTRFALGSCDGVLELLDRSEQVQGRRTEIDRLRRDVERQCSDGKGHGRGSGGGDDDG